MVQSLNSAEPAESGAVPVPPRFWWLKRISIAAAIFVATLIGVRLWWGQVAEQRLQATIAEYRAAGQPVTLSDFQAWMVTLPDEQNGAHFLKQAMNGMKAWSHQYIESSDIVCSPQLQADLQTQIRRFVEDNAGTFAQVRKARALAASDWKVNLTSPVMSVTLPHLSSVRKLAYATMLAALHHHAGENDAEALECVQDLLGIARHLSYRQPFLITQYVAMAIERQACTYVLESIVLNLSIADDQTTCAEQPSPATTRQVKQLIGELLAEESSRERWVAAMYGERLRLLDTADGMADGRISPLSVAGRRGRLMTRLAGLLARPALKLNAVRLMEHCSIYARAGVQLGYVDLEALPDLPLAESAPELVARFLSNVYLAGYESGLKAHFRSVVQRRMAATALALRLYELDHGRRPERLAELVPDYLPAVPRDPFDPDDGEIRYLPDATSPRLYSLATNGMDDGGDYVLDSGRINVWEKDMPFFLSGDRPVPPPPSLYEWTQQNFGQSPPPPASSQAVENDQAVEQTQRQ